MAVREERLAKQGVSKEGVALRGEFGGRWNSEAIACWDAWLFNRLELVREIEAVDVFEGRRRYCELGWLGLAVWKFGSACRGGLEAG